MDEELVYETFKEVFDTLNDAEALYRLHGPRENIAEMLNTQIYRARQSLQRLGDYIEVWSMAPAESYDDEDDDDEY